MKQTPKSSRVRHSADEWAKLIAQESQSPLATQEFCKQNELNASSFYCWRKRLSLSSRPSSFVEVAVTPATSSPTASNQSAIELVLRNGRILRVTSAGFDDQLLMRLMTVAEGASSC